MSDKNGTVPLLDGGIYKVFFIILFLFSLYLGFALIEPFMHTLIFSTVLAVLFTPVFTWALNLCKGRRTLASALTVGIIVFALLLPMTFLIMALISQGVESLVALNAWIVQGTYKTFLSIEMMDKYIAMVHEALPFLRIDEVDIQAGVLQYSREFAQSMLAFGTSLARDGAKLILHFLLMVFILFYFMRDGTKMVAYIKHLSPLRPRQEDYIIESLKRVARGVLMGCLLVALLQGFAGGIGLAVVGIPAFFWGGMMALSSLIPVVGTGLVWVPSVLYLFFVGDWKMALFLSLWCGIFVVGIDTILRPIFMREAARVSTFYIFLAILGGIYSFGMLGIFYGPLILSFVMVMLQIYIEEYAEDLKDIDDGACE
ncbi:MULTISPECIES: AI-2E family transporter [unclassified Pseudodesulfovibrio]|uniref:AI-2E family transporter n=1 Tax=unclassified Pseudodesulfovibrio TaxID=2661612 RepID=UPI000FEB7133|nr:MULTISPECIES: AI-2E family transporter [unclassified Pseudodesulfovibrio]MCJ2164122.1 AI-2E family transporter [Pseudodesulfovibrio sp. S3-i]RWU05249.1 AI-2E family transporter [Pseudodesulfovibrio sp. S3]